MQLCAAVHHSLTAEPRYKLSGDALASKEAVADDMRPPWRLEA